MTDTNPSSGTRPSLTIALAADHNGFALKEQLKGWLLERGDEVRDFGAASLDLADDYPDYGIPASRFVAEDPVNRRGILICGSGNGLAVVANKTPGLRAIVVSRTSEFANDEFAPVLALPANNVGLTEAQRIIERWLESLEQPLAERHLRRIDKIQKLETGS